MSELRRWAGPLDLGPFRFGTGPTGPMAGLALRADAGGTLRDDSGAAFCTAAELHAADSLAWRGLPALTVAREDGPPTCAVWMDARGIETPERFRAAVLRHV